MPCLLQCLPRFTRATPETFEALRLFYSIFNSIVFWLTRNRPNGRREGHLALPRFEVPMQSAKPIPRGLQPLDVISRRCHGATPSKTSYVCMFNHLHVLRPHCLHPPFLIVLLCCRSQSLDRGRRPLKPAPLCLVAIEPPQPRPHRRSLQRSTGAIEENCNTLESVLNVFDCICDSTSRH